MSGGGNAEIAEQDLMVSSNEHVFWLDIAVDMFMVVSILQSFCDLLCICYNGCQRNTITLAMTPT
jgi:hypothetical protein